MLFCYALQYLAHIWQQLRLAFSTYHALLQFRLCPLSQPYQLPCSPGSNLMLTASQQLETGCYQSTVIGVIVDHDLERSIINPISLFSCGKLQLMLARLQLCQFTYPLRCHALPGPVDHTPL